MKALLTKLPLAGLLVALALPSIVLASAPDPRAIAALKRMSTTLSSAKALTFNSRTAFEVPAKNGQFLTFFSTANVALKRPDKLRARLSGEAPQFDFFYDGTNVAAYAPATKVYSVTQAPPTIDAMLSGLEAETGIRFVTAPLLRSNPFGVLEKGIKSALFVGPTVIRGTLCDHLAFQSEGVNWEVWVEEGSRALPLRLAVTFTDRANYPRTLVEFSDWNLRPSLRPSDFTFRAPAGTREIPFRSVWKSSGR